MVRRSLPLMLVSMFALGCGDDKIRQQEIPTIEVRAGQQTLAEGATVFLRADQPLGIDVANSGTGALEIRELVIESDPVGAFAIASQPMPTTAAPVAVQPGALAHRFTVSYDATVGAGAARPAAVVRIRTNLTLSGDNEFSFRVEPEVAISRLVVTPPILDFATVEADQAATKTANLLNTGAREVAITRIVFTGHAGYRATIGGVEYAVGGGAGSGGVTLPTPLRIAPGNAEKVDVTFSAADEGGAEGRIVFYTDEGDEGGLLLKLYANLAGPCIAAKPSRVSFGGKLVGQQAVVLLELQSCGDVELVVSSIAMSDSGGGVFGVQAAAAGTFPLTIPAASSIFVPVTYLPTTLAPIVGGQLVLDRGHVLVRSDAYLGDLDVPVEGFGTDGSCPVAVITVAEGDRVVPQTVLHLDGAGSSSEGGAITSYAWTVVQPSGSVSVFAPSAAVAAPTFEANIVGDYIFFLTVEDESGVPSCAPGVVTVTVLPEDAIHVELVWRTPGDPDESDTGGDQVSFSAGSDVDLHFLHPDSRGIWFSPDYDCYWDNITPSWGGPGADDDPRLDRDDTDGGGPENLNMLAPEADTRYRVGIHYWNDWGFGNALATINVYIYGVLRDRWSDVELVHDDLWDAYTIEWPSRTVTRLNDGVPDITPDYREIGPGR